MLLVTGLQEGENKPGAIITKEEQRKERLVHAAMLLD